MGVLLATVANNVVARSDEPTRVRQQALEKMHAAYR